MRELSRPLRDLLSLFLLPSAEALGYWRDAHSGLSVKLRFVPRFVRHFVSSASRRRRAAGTAALHLQPPSAIATGW